MASFHEIIINWSYRTRGKEARAHTNIRHNTIIFVVVTTPPRNSNDERNLRNMSIPYSLIKMRANSPPPYSTLNPETISDSPSAKSNGVRFASAKHSMSHARNVGIISSATHNSDCIILISVVPSVFISRTREITKRAKHTS